MTHYSVLCCIGEHLVSVVWLKSSVRDTKWECHHLTSGPSFHNFTMFITITTTIMSCKFEPVLATPEWSGRSECQHSAMGFDFIIAPLRSMTSIIHKSLNIDAQNYF